MLFCRRSLVPSSRIWRTVVVAPPTTVTIIPSCITKEKCIQIISIFRIRIFTIEYIVHACGYIVTFITVIVLSVTAVGVITAIAVVSATRNNVGRVAIVSASTLVAITGTLVRVFSIPTCRCSVALIRTPSTASATATAVIVRIVIVAVVIFLAPAVRHILVVHVTARRAYAVLVQHDVDCQ